MARNPRRGRKKLRTKALLRVPMVCTLAPEGCAVGAGTLEGYAGDQERFILTENGDCQHFLAAPQCCEVFLLKEDLIALSGVQALCSWSMNLSSKEV